MLKSVIRLVLMLTLIATLSVAGLPGPTHAAPAQQSSEPPLVILMDGDLWLYSEAQATLTQLTRYGYNQQPRISPDGRKIAYASVADLAVPALQKFGETPNVPPANIWIWDLATAQARRIVDQPPGATFGSGNQSETFTRRSTPAWSPDGTMLAWVEFTVAPSSLSELVVFDVNLNAIRTRTPITIAQQFPISAPKWGQGGIALRVTIPIDSSDRLLVYDMFGSLKLNAIIGGPGITPIADFFFMMQNGQEYLGLVNTKGEWTLVTPATGAVLAPIGIPEMVSASTSPAAISTYFMYNRPTQTGVQWFFTTGDFQNAPLPFYGLVQQMAIAPSGSALAFAQDAVYIWRAGQIIKVPGTERMATKHNGALAWGYNGWRSQIQQRPQPTIPPIAGTCPGAPPTRLTIGSVGRVAAFPSQSNALNSAPGRPSRNASIVRLGLIPVGGTFTVLDGPICADDLLWWKVNYNNLVGWTAEGEGTTYWIEPFNGTVSAGCPENLPSRMVPGNQGRVTPGTPNALRTQPTSNNALSSVFGAIPGKGVFTVLAGPICADGFAWWQVSYQGLVGWTAEGQNGVYWLEPLICGFKAPSRMQVGGRGVVLPGLPNAIRSLPSKDRGSSAVLGEIGPGEQFLVTGGPVCSDNLVWWQIRDFQGIRAGWTPEGEGETYWIGPVR